MARPPSKLMLHVRPDLIDEWHFELNVGLSPETMSYASSKKVWWKCIKNPNHIWRCALSNRTRLLSACPYCAGNVLCDNNRLSILNPSYIKEWHPTKNEPLTPHDVAIGSGIKVWWQCKINSKHEYQASCLDRKRGKGCSYCAGKRVLAEESLLATHPDLCKEWDYNLNELRPDQVTYGSHKKIWWICRNNANHKYYSVIKSRTIDNTGCHRCAESKGEKKIAKILTTKNIKFHKQYRFKECRNILPLPFDFAIMNESDKLILLIEYQGEQHYRPMRFREKQTNFKKNLEKTKKHDEIKRRFCKDNGIPLLEIHYKDFDEADVIVIQKLKELNII